MLLQVKLTLLYESILRKVSKLYCSSLNTLQWQSRRHVAVGDKVRYTQSKPPILSGIYVENLSEYVVRDSEDVYSLMQLGKKRLIFAETKMNRTSSRFVTDSNMPWIFKFSSSPRSSHTVDMVLIY